MTPPGDATDAGWRLATLTADETWRRISAVLHDAVVSARHPFHLLTVATVDQRGGPQTRTVVLRWFDGPGREIRFHTDVRSAKVAQLAHDSRVALHWYSAADRLQLRIDARATLHHRDGIAREAWNESPPMSRACYTAPNAPGTPLPTFPAAPSPPSPDDDHGLDTFVVVRCRFARVDVLALHATGHERVVLALDGPNPVREIVAP